MFNTLEEYLHWAEQEFIDHDLYFGHGTDNAWDEAVMLAMFVLKLPADVGPDALAMQIQAAQQQELLKLTRRRIDERIPVPYLTNEAWFAGRRYYIDQNAIIPRSPFAELIDNHFQPWLGSAVPHKILDLCTGSGCIAIHCAKEFPEAQVDAIDISPQALQVALKNKELHTSSVNFIKSDLFAAVKGKKYDIIMSNPPYVNADDLQAMPDEYRHEPSLALASGVDGLELTERILREAKEYLTSDGLLIVEVGNSWHALEGKYPKLPFVWLEFEHGGEGVFLLQASDLC